MIDVTVTEPIIDMYAAPPVIEIGVGELIGGAGGTGGTGDHRDLTHRNDADQHTIAAITGLQDALDGAGGTVEPRVLVANDTETNEYTIGRLEDGSLEYNEVEVFGELGLDEPLFRLPAPTNSRERVSFVRGAYVANELQSYSVYWLDPTPTAGALVFDAILALSLPLAVDTAVTVTIAGETAQAVLNDTYGNLGDLLTALVGGWFTDNPTLATLVEVDDDYNGAPALVTIGTGADQSVSIDSATNGDPLGMLDTTRVQGVDEQVRGALNELDGTLGVPGSAGGTHVSPSQLSSYHKGVELIDGDGVWLIAPGGWPMRLTSMPGGNNTVRGDGPSGTLVEQSDLAGTLTALTLMGIDPLTRTVRSDDEIEDKRFRMGDDSQSRDFYVTLLGEEAGVDFVLPEATEAHRFQAIMKRPADDDGAGVVRVLVDNAGTIDGEVLVGLDPGDCLWLFSTDTESGYQWTIRAHYVANPATGAGSGDMLAANNLTDLADPQVGMNVLLDAQRIRLSYYVASLLNDGTISYEWTAAGGLETVSIPGCIVDLRESDMRVIDTTLGAVCLDAYAVGSNDVQVATVAGNAMRLTATGKWND